MIPILYRLRNGVTFLLTANTVERSVINNIWIDEVYIPNPDWSIRPDWTVVDIGAHKGIFAVYAALRAKEVWAVEGNPSTYPVLLANLSTNGLLDKVKTFGVIIGNHDGITEFHVYRDVALSSSVSRDDLTAEMGWSGSSANVTKTLRLPTISMSRFLKDLESVDLVKMSLAGSEYDLILFPASECWLQKVQRLAVNYLVRPSFPSGPDALAECLQSQGFHTSVREDVRVLYADRRKPIAF